MTTIYSTPAGTTATPVIVPSPGSYPGNVEVSMSCATPGSNIYYTLDSSVPTYPLTGTTALYTNPIEVTVNTTVSAIGATAGFNNSAVGNAAFVITIVPVVLPNVDAPSFSIAGGTYTSNQSVSISCATANATIYYTVDGSVPTTNSTQYTAPIEVTSNVVISAFATETGFNDSPVSVVSYTISIPVVVPPPPPVVGTRSKYTQPFANTSFWNDPASVVGTGVVHSAPVFPNAASRFSNSYFVEWEHNIVIGKKTMPYAVTEQYMYIQQGALNWAETNNLIPLTTTTAFNSTAGDSLAAAVSGNKYPIPDNYAGEGFGGNYGDQGWTATSPNNIKANFVSAILLGDDDTISNNQQFSRYPAGAPAGTGTLYDEPTKKDFNSSLPFNPSITVGDGRFGAHGASRLSSLGGSLRLFDLQQGVISHALKVVIGHNDCWGGGNGTNFTGEHLPKSNTGYSNNSYGYVYPAYCKDDQNYTGTNPDLRMGSLLQIPSNVELSSLGNAFGYTPGPHGGFDTVLGQMIAVCM